MKVLFTHPELRALSFLILFPSLLHKYTHMFICEKGNQFTSIHPKRLTVLMLICFSFLSVMLVPSDTTANFYTLRRSHREIWKISTLLRWEMNSAGLAKVLDELLNCLVVTPAGWMNGCLLRGARRDSTGSSLQLNINKKIQRSFYQSFTHPILMSLKSFFSLNTGKTKSRAAGLILRWEILNLQRLLKHLSLLYRAFSETLSVCCFHAGIQQESIFCVSFR